MRSNVTSAPEAMVDVARLMDGCLITQLLYVAAKLGLGDALAEGPRTADTMDLHMLALFGGRERTTAEYEELLTATGFRLQRAVPTRSPAGIEILEATPG